MIFIQRELITKIKPFLKRPEFLSISGPRQSGKTTFLEILKDCLLGELGVEQNCVQEVTFEDRRLLLQFEQDAVAFVQSYRRDERAGTLYLMIDEFQYAQDGGQKLKLIYDTVKDIKIIITGSSSLEIKAKVGKYMVGRMLNFYLYPFNFREYLRAKNKRMEAAYVDKSARLLGWLRGDEKADFSSGKDIFCEELSSEFERFCIWGGYPAVVLAQAEPERKKLLSDIFNNYMLKDIKTLFELATERGLFLLAQYLSTQIGSTVVYQNLGQVSGLGYRNLKKHISLLEETFICSPLRPFFKNRQKELSKNPKIFFMDMGFRNHLVENTNGLQKRSDAGAVIENACFIRLKELFEGIDKINFWRTKAGAEVDFILHAAGGIIPIEVKYANFSSAKAPRGLVSFINSFNPARAMVLTRDFWGSAVIKNTRILFAPVYYL